MCLGIPMEVVEADESSALCRSGDALRRVDTLLVGRADPGDWLLVHVTSAVRRLDAAEARLIEDALRAADAAARGLPFEHLISDLIDREPELPPHLAA